jgi:HSP20 family molecular chaperone IbpA
MNSPQPFDRDIDDILANFARNRRKNRQLINQRLVDDSSKLEVVADIPNVDKENIDLSVENGSRQLLVVEINTSNRGERITNKGKIKLSKEVEPETARATFKNGVLTVLFGLADEENESIEIN